MTSAQPTCPYCNAPVAAVAREARQCARCGERLPASFATVAPPSESTPQQEDVPASTPPGQGRTLAVVLTIMVVMAGIGLSYALWTVSFRRANDFRTKKGTPLVLQSSAPAHVPALGLLPARSNVVAALNVAELLKHPASRRLFDEPRPALLAWLFAGLEKWTGLEPADIDHVALASEIRTDLPRLTVLVHTRQPFPPHKIAERLAPAQPTKHRNNVLVRFPLQPAGEALLWRHSERVLAFVLCLDAAKLDDLDAIPTQPRPGLEGFAEPLRDAIEQRLDKQSALWIAGDLGESTVIGDAVALTGLTTKGWAPLLGAKRFVAGVTPREDLTLLAHLFTGDAKAGVLKQWLEKRRWPERTSHKVEAPPPDAAASEQWLTLQVRGDVELVRNLLSATKQR
jgi:hypothetical protein